MWDPGQETPLPKRPERSWPFSVISGACSGHRPAWVQGCSAYLVHLWYELPLASHAESQQVVELLRVAETLHELHPWRLPDARLTCLDLRLPLAFRYSKSARARRRGQRPDAPPTSRPPQPAPPLAPPAQGERSGLTGVDWSEPLAPGRRRPIGGQRCLAR